MIERLNPYEGYRRSAMLGPIFGQVIAKRLRDLAILNTEGDIETLVKTAQFRQYLSAEYCDKVLEYFSLKEVESIEKDVPQGIKQAAIQRANSFYKEYLEKMNSNGQE
jgi:hypothetical protein